MKEKLFTIQQELNVPKNQYNKFGGFAFRSCEDILTAVKPLLKKLKCILILNDEVKLIGERYYVESTASLIDLESDEVISNKASSREELVKKGMDPSQITGASSSYARKYALNGLFGIDDVKDSDTTNTGEVQQDEPTLQDAQQYVINFGKKHPGELLIDVYKNDYDFIEYILQKKQDDKYLIKCIELLDKQKQPIQQTENDQDERLALQVKFEKLILDTNTAKEDIYNYYKVANNTEMSVAQFKDAITILESKGKNNGK